VYRPTVRYDDSFKEYVDGLFVATTLDRNQIMRLALFLLGHTREGKDVLTSFATSPLPQPNWELNSTVLWYGKPLNLTILNKEEGVTSDVIDNQESVSRPQGQAARRDDREICKQAEKKKVRYIARIGDNTTFVY
jgi:hypothetical protein